jgi:hypothetical protein
LFISVFNGMVKEAKFSSISRHPSSKK